MQDSSSRSSRIGQGTTIQGTVSGSGDLEIAGFVHGSITVDGEVAVEDSGRVRAVIDGRSVSVRGAVAGDLRATESIVLESGARVVGDLAAPSVGIRPGGLLRGHVSTSGAPATPARSSAARSSSARSSSARSSSARGSSARSSSARSSSARKSTRAKSPEPEMARDEFENDELPDSEQPAAAGRPSPGRRGGASAPAPRMPNLTKKTGSARSGEPKASRNTKQAPRARKAAPAPVVPSLKKGAKGTVRRRAR